MHLNIRPRGQNLSGKDSSLAQSKVLESVKEGIIFVLLTVFFGFGFGFLFFKISFVFPVDKHLPYGHSIRKK